MSRFLYRQAIVWIMFVLIELFSLSVQAATPEKINASYGAISGTMSPIWVAKEARLFEKQGLDLNLVYIPGGPRSIMSLLGGSVQFVNQSARTCDYGAEKHRRCRTTTGKGVGNQHGRFIDRYLDA